DSYAEVVRVLLSEMPESILTRARNLQQSLDQLAASTFDLILLDPTLPDGIGLQTCTRIHAASPSLPIIILSGLDDQTVPRQAFLEGAQDYLVKGQTNGKILVRAIHHALERHAAAQAFGQNEAFFRPISENVTD